MRIERIAFQAFGPYVNKVELAMEELSKHRLFLIKGATGAGKTVIPMRSVERSFKKRKRKDRANES